MKETVTSPVLTRGTWCGDPTLESRSEKIALCLHVVERLWELPATATQFQIEATLVPRGSSPVAKG